MNETDPILITGATGKIGRVLVRYFAENGRTVVATAPNPDTLAALVTELQGKRVVTIPANLADASGIEQLMQQLSATKLFPSVLINNARNAANLDVASDGRPSHSAWLAEFALGVVAPYELAWSLAHRPDGNLKNVVNVSSMYGIVAMNPSLYSHPSQQSPVHYGPVKSALIQLTKELAVRLAAKAIRVNAVSFGGVEGRVDASFQARYAKLNPLGRMLRETEVVGAVDFLVSDGASAMTGHNLVVDGGWTIW